MSHKATHTQDAKRRPSSSSKLPVSSMRFSDSIDINSCSVTRLYCNGVSEVASLEEGPNGFAVYKFGGVETESEVTNLMLSLKAAANIPGKAQGKKGG